LNDIVGTSNQLSSLAAQGRLKRLAKRLYHTVALKRAQAMRLTASDKLQFVDVGGSNFLAESATN
jgi:hypothetical protein